MTSPISRRPTKSSRPSDPNARRHAMFFLPIGDFLNGGTRSPVQRKFVKQDSISNFNSYFFFSPFSFPFLLFFIHLFFFCFLKKIFIYIHVFHWCAFTKCWRLDPWNGLSAVAFLKYVLASANSFFVSWMSPRCQTDKEKSIIDQRVLANATVSAVTDW